MDPMKQAAAPEDESSTLEEECRAWEWAKTSGVSPDELRRAVQEALRQPAQR